MKNCCKCKKDKDDSEFNFNKFKNKLEYQCRECHSLYLKDHYANNKKYYTDKSKKRRTETLIWFKEYKSKLKCETCGENHPACLDFHHEDRSIKEMEIYSAVNRGWSEKRILKEIAKCKVLCCKCHRILHYEERINGLWV